MNSKNTKNKSDNKKSSGSLNDKDEPGIVLFVGPVPDTLVKWIEKEKQNKNRFLFYNLQSAAQKKEIINGLKKVFDEVLTCSFKNDNSIQETLLPIRDKIVAITSRSEAKMWYFKRVIPHVPYVLSPTESSLIWATDKIQMRLRMRTYDSSIAPSFVIVNDIEDKVDNIVSYIEKRLKYPVMVKPSGLSASMLVTNCYHKEELKEAIQSVSKQAKLMHKDYKEFYKSNTPQVLVEEMMEGDMYSVDGVVNAKGKCFFYPSVHVKTGKQIGFDDYFGYMQITPTLLEQESYEKMIEVAQKGIHALGLRNTTFHAEMMKTEKGWKIIEIAPRLGGFRQELYLNSYGIDPTENDIKIRLGLVPILKKQKKAYTAALKIYAKKEGKIKQIKGEKKIKELESVIEVRQFKKTGDRAVFAKNGGKGIFVIILSNKDRSKLLADIRRIEQNLEIIVQ